METKLVFHNEILIRAAMAEVVKEFRDFYRSSFLPVNPPQASQAQSNDGVDRRALVEAYIESKSRETGKRVTRTEIWKKAGYHNRTEFERWQRNDPRTTKIAHERFMQLLTLKKAF
jgi:hypothetical protein